MKGELVLFDELSQLFSMEFNPGGLTQYDFGFELLVENGSTLKQQLERKELFEEGFDWYIDLLTTNNDVEQINKYTNLKQIIDNLFDYIEYVHLNFTNTDVIKFIKNNPIIREKKIVLSEIIKITDYEKINELMKQYYDYKDELYVKMENNFGYVTISQCFDTMIKIKQQAEKIKSLNLSMMETILYTYDQVRNRIYKMEDDGDSPLESRDLCSVLSGDKIVCVGYANIFSALLRYMGIDCENVGLSFKDSNEGHERNLIYVKDEKYGIDGAYYFDVTADSKLELENNKFLNRLKFFGKTRSEMMILDEDKFNYDQIPYYSENIVREIELLLKAEQLDVISEMFLKSINYMSGLINGKPLFDVMNFNKMFPSYNKFDRKKTLIELKKITEKFNKPISAETYIKLLNNVRKIEYYENPDFYPYSLEDMYKTYIFSNWKFSKHHYNIIEQVFMDYKFENEINLINKNRRKNDFIRFANEEDIEKQIKQVQLTKILQKIK